MGKQPVNFITCDCESSAPYFVNYKAGANPRVLVIGLYELLGNPTTHLIEPPGPKEINNKSYHTNDNHTMYVPHGIPKDSGVY